MKYFFYSYLVYFHIAHLFEVQGKHKTAKEAYEQLLEQKDLSLNIRAEASKNLGNVTLLSYLILS